MPSGSRCQDCMVSFWHAHRWQASVHSNCTSPERPQIMQTQGTVHSCVCLHVRHRPLTLAPQEQSKAPAHVQCSTRSMQDPSH